MPSARYLIALPLVALVAVSACRRHQPDPPAVATPKVTFKQTRVPAGSPVEATFRFDVAPNAPAFDGDYKVMVHFLDADEELMWTEDHDPSIPTSQWKPGQTIEYTKTLFVPISTYVGQTTVKMGLYSPKSQKRLSLAGETTGQLEYKVASLQLLPHSENVFILFKEGWHPAEVAAGNSTVEWQWTKKTAALAFRNPKKASVFYLHADNPSSFAEPQVITLKVNGQQVDTIAVTPRQEFIHKTPLTAAQLGSGDMVELTIDVDKTIVPALIPAAQNRDPRELGIRVFHAFVEPQS